MPDVLLAYALAALLVAIVFVIAFFIGRAVRTGPFVGFVGLILIAIAILEKAGWTTRPWRPGTPAAGLDDLFFRILFLVGIGLLVITWTAAFRTRS